MFKQILHTLGKTVADIADKTVDSITHPIENMFGGVATRCTLFSDCFKTDGKHGNKETPEIDYAPIKQAAIEKNPKTVELVDKATAQPKQAEEKEKGLEQEASLSL